ncbi:NAD-dependent epimerase/dehydratase family protein [Sanguibacteroides justesenii]|uniref:UDP-galactose-4-epimerase n=1 Tax=Sanguibacteroides justesenii TaxID=1547597 RepID=A0AB34R770_9PORP|nr:NAD-dependent epimerase/dehydratase family protein [Sanguibacteroides justesenii]KIO46953.1 UDP-galactose-4-epimerase [Sanguibacteroides justesenii]
MNLLFTGASGFLGKEAGPLLSKKYELETIGLTSFDNYTVNLAKEVPVLSKRYDVVLHAAGKAHVIPGTEKEKQEFYEVNLQGTRNLCEALEKAGVPGSFVFISTVAVYGCESGRLIGEDHPLNGNTPYADSKKQAEIYLQEWCSIHNVILTILRPSLLAGKNPPGNLGSMIEGIRTGRYLSIAGGKARKSVLMAEDIARLLFMAADKGGIYNVCDNEHPSFRQLEKTISVQLGKKLPVNIPYWLAKALALAGDCLGNKAPINSSKLDKITRSLTFSNEKAKRVLGWEPLNVLEHFKIH